MSGDAEAQPAGGRRRRNKLMAYYGIADEEKEKEKEKALPQSELDHEDFDAYAYVGKMLKTARVKDLVSQDVTITKEVHELDAQLQMLVYGNYTNFISATELISNMKTSVDTMKEQMATLDANLAKVSGAHHAMQRRVAPLWAEVEKLSSITVTLKKIDFLVRLPDRLQHCLKSGAHKEVVRYWLAAQRILQRHSHIKSFANVRQQCLPTVEEVQAKLRAGIAAATLETSQSAASVREAVSLLVQLDASYGDALPGEVFAVLRRTASEGYVALCDQLAAAHKTALAAATAASLEDDVDDDGSASGGDASSDDGSDVVGVGAPSRGGRLVHGFFATAVQRLQHARSLLDEFSEPSKYEPLAKGAPQEEGDGEETPNPLSLDYYADRCVQILRAQTAEVVKKVFQEVLVRAVGGEDSLSELAGRCAGYVTARVAAELRAVRMIHRRRRTATHGLPMTPPPPAAMPGCFNTPVRGAAAAASPEADRAPPLAEALKAAVQGLMADGPRCGAGAVSHALAAAGLLHALAALHEAAGFDRMAREAMQEYLMLSGEALSPLLRQYFHAAQSGRAPCVDGAGGERVDSVARAFWKIAAKIDTARIQAMDTAPQLERESTAVPDRDARSRNSRNSADAYSRGGLSRYTTGGSGSDHGSHSLAHSGGLFAPDLHRVFAQAPAYSLGLESLRPSAVVRTLVLYVLKTVLEYARVHCLAPPAAAQLQVDVAFLAARFQEAMRADPKAELVPMAEEIAAAAQGRTVGQPCVLEAADVDAVVARVMQTL
eukprot:TRINITY_DN7510_c0_g1_i1.p1 TRINITY_DN7510_c0_g1~~TRINITY_DN7510_c0_g1_i1.p1  ORF type:complete len:775 (+),score=264.84 TRINITY_DN7510_c0_g1_i1:43-2367(+)